MSNKVKIFFAISSFLMALGIALGAFGAHGLKSVLDERMLEVYKTGVQYHFYNTLGLFAATIIFSFKETKKKYISLFIILIGMLIFSFSLYILTIFNMPMLGIITPIGGTLLIIGWLTLCYSILKD